MTEPVIETTMGAEHKDSAGRGRGGAGSRSSGAGRGGTGRGSFGAGS